MTFPEQSRNGRKHRCDTLSPESRERGETAPRKLVAPKLKRRAAVQLAAGTAVVLFPCKPSKADPLGKVLGRRQTGPSIFKSRAIADYHANMAPLGGRLASPSSNLLQCIARPVPYQFDVLIIGSGYGAAITAARLAQFRRPDCRVAILERGREWIPGTFPDRLPDVMAEARLTTLGPKKGEVNKATGLFNVQQFDEITVLSGSGLGGSSLINASVSLRPDRDVFDQSVWPEKLRGADFWEPYFQLAEYELGVAQEPCDYSHKMIAQRIAAEQLAASGAHWEPANLMVTRAANGELPVLNRQGMRQRGCIDCGDCLTGCNVGAKNTLAVNYLPQARRAGAELYDCTEVHCVRKVNGLYEVHFTHTFEAADGTITPYRGVTTARVVVLGAGSLGSTEILLRSQSPELHLSARLGCSWTGNGDALGFIRKGDLPTGVGGYSAYPAERFPVGPTIQSNLTYPNRNLPGRILIQEGAAARAYANAIGTLMGNLKLDDLQILLGMGHDGAAGRIRLDENGNGRIFWPELLESPYRKLIRGEFQRLAQAMGGEYRYLKIFGDRMISVHPLGGCAMADDPARGVVNHQGQVFDAYAGGEVDPQTGEAKVHEGLYVIDGGMLPTSIACNPSLTIAALAERSAEWIINHPAYQDLFVSSDEATL